MPGGSALKTALHNLYRWVNAGGVGIEIPLYNSLKALNAGGVGIEITTVQFLKECQCRGGRHRDFGRFLTL